MNVATHDQDPLHIYGKDSYERLKSIRDSVDRRGVSKSRTNGFNFA